MGTRLCSWVTASRISGCTRSMSRTTSTPASQAAAEAAQCGGRRSPGVGRAGRFDKDVADYKPKYVTILLE